MLRIDMFGFGLGLIDDFGRERAQTYTYYFWAENIPIFFYIQRSDFFVEFEPLDECEIHLISLEFKGLSAGFYGPQVKV